MFFAGSYYYWLPILLQALCVWHCVKKHRPNTWIWIIVFLPIVGSLVYIFSEVFSGRDIEKVQTGMGNIFNPGSSVRRLEENLRFSDTFANRIALADACLATGDTSRAIELYESSLNGNFSENEHVQCQLMIAYYQQKRYEEVISIGKKLYKRPQFARSKQHILYAASLGNMGRMEEAESEFRTMKARYAN